MPTPVTNRRNSLAFIACALAFWLLGTSTHASIGELPRLALTQYSSASGDWVLTIDPSSRDGIGPTRYEMRHRDAIVWETTLPFALWHAAVADDGRSGGAGYDTGYAGIRESGHFIVALFDARGHSIGVDKTARGDHPWPMHDYAYPRSEGVWLDAERNALVVRVNEYDKARDAFPERWWHYDLTRGERTGVVEPQKPAVETGDLGYARHMIPVQGTPLVLAHSLHWIHTDANQTTYGSHYAVLDADGQPIWSLLLQADIATESHYPHERLRQLEGVRSQQPGFFSVQSLQRDMWLEFQAVEDGDAASGWRIETSGETPSAPKEAAPELPLIELAHLGSIDLSGGGQADAPRRIEHFAIDAQGRIGVIDSPGNCAWDEARYRLSLHSTDGAPLASRSLDALELDQRDKLHITALANGDWLLTASSTTPQSRARAFVFDAQTLQFDTLDAFDVQHVAALASSPVGGFVVLEKKHGSHSPDEMLHGYGSDGKRHWSVASDYNDEAALFSPEDIAVLRDGTVAVLENVGEKVKRYDTHGHHLGTIDLKKAWSHTPNYTTTIFATPDGGFWIEDFRGTAQLVHMDHDGNVTRTLKQLRYGDGRAMPKIGTIAVAPDGALWADDYSAVFQLDATGQAQLTIGSAPDTARLGEVETLNIAPDGQMVALDGRNHALHHFNADGRVQRVLINDTRDFPPDANDAWVALMPNGEALAGWDASGYVHFDTDGQRTGYRRFAERRGLFGKALPHARADRLWWREFKSVSLIALDGQTIVRHERDANGQWLSDLSESAVAPDGSLAIGKGLDAEPVVTLLDAQGALIASWPVPLTDGDHLSGLAFDGHTIVAVGRSPSDTQTRPVQIVGLDTQGNAQFRAEVETRGVWDAFHVRRGDVSELWIRSGSMRLERYAWPQLNDSPDQKAD